MLVPGVDVRDPPPIADDLHRLAEPGIFRVSSPHGRPATMAAIATSIAMSRDRIPPTRNRSRITPVPRLPDNGVADNDIYLAVGPGSREDATGAVIDSKNDRLGIPIVR